MTTLAVAAAVDPESQVPDEPLGAGQGHGIVIEAHLVFEGCLRDDTLAGLNAVTDLALNHRLEQGRGCGVGGGLDSTDLQKDQ